MTTEEKIAAILAMHKEEGIECPMVYEVWNDGEVTLTKGGDLYGQRTLHTTIPALFDTTKHLPADSLVKRFNNSRVVVMNRDEAKAVRAILMNGEFDLYAS